MGPVEAVAGQKLYLAPIKAGMDAVAVELDFVRPVRPSGAIFTSCVIRGWDLCRQMNRCPPGCRSRYYGPSNLFDRN